MKSPWGSLRRHSGKQMMKKVIEPPTMARRIEISWRCGSGDDFFILAKLGSYA